MKSIRLSLIVYFLVLLALALGTASAFVYETTRNTLAGRKAALQTLLKEKHDHRVQEVRDQFDRDLLAQAWTLGSLAQFQHDWPRGWLLRNYLCLGVLSAAPSPNGHLLVPLWTSQVPPPQGSRDPLSDRWLMALVSKIKFDEEVLLGNAAGHEHDYFQ